MGAAVDILFFLVTELKPESFQVTLLLINELSTFLV